MPVLPPAGLAVLRGVAEGAMDDTCQVLRLPAVPSRGPSGGLQGEFSVAATVSCRVAPGWQPPFERAFGGGIAAQAAAFVYVPLETDVRAADRIRITSGNETGHEWEVTATFKRRTEEVQLTVLCQEVGQ